MYPNLPQHYQGVNSGQSGSQRPVYQYSFTSDTSPASYYASAQETSFLVSGGYPHSSTHTQVVSQSDHGQTFTVPSGTPILRLECRYPEDTAIVSGPSNTSAMQFLPLGDQSFSAYCPRTPLPTSSFYVETPGRFVSFQNETSTLQHQEFPQDHTHNLSHSTQVLTYRPLEDMEFVDRSFPLATEDHAHKRELLKTIMSSPWKLTNEFEPQEGLLVHFLRQDTQTARWDCTFSDGNRPCGASFSKRDQAKSHIRVHIKHYPYACKDRGLWRVIFWVLLFSRSSPLPVLLLIPLIVPNDTRR